MTFDMVMMLMGWHYDSFDCLSFNFVEVGGGLFLLQYLTGKNYDLSIGFCSY